MFDCGLHHMRIKAGLYDYNDDGLLLRCAKVSLSFFI